LSNQIRTTWRRQADQTLIELRHEAQIYPLADQHASHASQPITRQAAASRESSRARVSLACARATPSGYKYRWPFRLLQTLFLFLNLPCFSWWCSGRPSLAGLPCIARCGGWPGISRLRESERRYFCWLFIKLLLCCSRFSEWLQAAWFSYFLTVRFALRGSMERKCLIVSIEKFEIDSKY
jgi:hypothetical protein